MSLTGYEEEPDPPKPFFLVVISEGEPAQLAKYDTKEKLVAFLRDHFHPEAGSRVQVYIFQGDRLHITKGSFKYLLQDGSEPSPLFEIPATEHVPSETGDWFDSDAGHPSSESNLTVYPSGPSMGGLGDDDEH